MGLNHCCPATFSAFISRNKNSALRYKVQFGADRFQRWLSVAGLLLVLVFAGLEAVHVHSDRSLSSHSGASCLLCISAHANAPTVVAHPLPVLFAVAMVAIPHDAQGQGIAARLELFIRPPPV